MPKDVEIALVIGGSPLERDTWNEPEERNADPLLDVRLCGHTRIELLRQKRQSKPTDQTQLACGRGGPMGWPVATSQICAVVFGSP